MTRQIFRDNAKIAQAASVESLLQLGAINILTATIESTFDIKLDDNITINELMNCNNLLIRILREAFVLSNDAINEVKEDVLNRLKPYIISYEK